MNDMSFRGMWRTQDYPADRLAPLSAAIDEAELRASADPPRLSIVVPCYNEEACLDMLHRRLSAVAQTVAGSDYEIVLVDDGSRDRTWDIIRTYSSVDIHIRGIRLSRNQGHQVALSAGLDLCRGELILIIDADLQDPPELLESMIDRLHEEQADVVYAVRHRRNGETLAKRATAKIFYRMLAALSNGTDIPLDTGDFRLMTRRALDVLQAMPERHRFIRGMVAWMGFKQVSLSYEREERFAGETHYPLVKMVRLALDALTSFSSVPLRLASYCGFVLSFCSLLVMAYAAIGWIEGKTIPGWTSLMIVILVMGSAQMLFLGVIGEYIGRLYHQAKNRPLYVVSEVAGGAIGQPKLGLVTPPSHG